MTRSGLSALLLSAALLSAAPLGARSYAVRVDEGEPGGPRVVSAHRPTADAVMVVSFPVGSVDDGIKNGLTRLSQHMLLDGNRREESGAFRRDLYAAAADLDITTEVRRSTITLRAPRGAFDALAERLLALLFAPKLHKRALARCKRLTHNDELVPAGREDVVSFLAGAALMVEGSDDAGGDFSNRPYGDDEVIRRLTFKDVERHVASKLQPANATIVLVGSFGQTAMERAIARYRGGARRPMSRPDIQPYLPLRFSRAAPRDVFVVAHVVELQTAEQAAAARLLEALLEERAGAKLKVAGVSDALEVFTLRREWLDLLMVEVPLSAGKGSGVETQLRSIVGDVRGGTFLPGEFERNKRFALNRMDRTDEDAGLLAATLAESARTTWHSAEVREALEGMSQAAFLAIARRWLDDKNTIRVSLGPEFAAERPR